MSFWVNTFSSVSIKSRSFLKRCFVTLLAIIIAFNFVCKPKETHAFAVTTLIAIITCLTGVVVGGATVYDIWKRNHNETDDFETYFSKNITVDGNGNYVISDAGMVTINEMQQIAKDMDTYTYGYLPGSKNLSNTGFNTKSAHDVVVSLLQGNPGSLFYIAGRVNQTHPTYGNVSCLRVNIFPVPYGGVGSPAMMVGSAVGYYSENWSNSFEYRTVYVYDQANNDAVHGMFYIDSSGERHELLEASEVLLDFDVKDVPVAGKEIIQGNTYSSRRDLSQISLNYGAGRVFTDYAGGFPVFNSYAALKKGLDDCTKMEYMPGYTGQPITRNTVTEQEINDYSTTYNYYYGDSSGGSGGSGSGSGSSGNWIDTIVNGIGAFFDGLLQILGKIIESLGKFMSLIADSFSDLSDLVPTNFINFLSQLFPFIPEEWVTAATLFITLALLGVLLKIFGK